MWNRNRTTQPTNHRNRRRVLQTTIVSVLVTIVASSSSSSTTTTRSKKPSSHDYLVRGLDQVEPAYSSFNGSMYAGLIPTQLYDSDITDDGKLMFWYFDPISSTYDDTIVIWLNGGPGCSSLGGCLFEHCPVTIPMHDAGYFGISSDPAILLPNPYAWTQTTKMIYIEQPHGTGFATGTFPTNETDVSRDFYNFLQNFYTLFPNLRSNKLYFFGESYAGMYVPSIAHYIHEQNKDTNVNLPRINLAGIGLGNGWMDATVQGPAVIDYAYWHGMIDSNTRQAFHNEWINCQVGKAVELGGNQFHEFTVPDECGLMGAVLEAAGAHQVPWGLPNAYDVSTWDPYTMLDDPKGKMATFYNNPEVQKALNVPVGTFWIECMPGAGRRRRRLDDLPGKKLLAHDQPESVVPYVADLLDDAGIRVLVYNGDRDMTTNSQGSEMLLDAMDWSGSAGWSDPSSYDRGLWLPRYDNTSVGGYMKQYKNLEFLVVINSGHLVPFNRPQLALELITRFLGEESFVDKTLPKYTIQASSLATSSSNGTDNTNNKGDSTTKIHTTSVVNDQYLEQYKKHQYHHLWYDIGKVLFIATIGFVLGYFISEKRSNSKRRSGYDFIDSA